MILRALTGFDGLGNQHPFNRLQRLCRLPSPIANTSPLTLGARTDEAATLCAPQMPDLYKHLRHGCASIVQMTILVL